MVVKILGMGTPWVLLEERREDRGCFRICAGSF
jgi:hypothetical protein